MKLQMSFGENLINLRKQKGWSQDDLADNLNLSRQAISKWENDTSKPDIDNIKKISKIFSVTIDDLLNNDVVKDKAVTLNVKKKEKKERTITIVKCMIIAVIILYIINVIFKFVSLLIIVNGIQKYANLSNYHYVITTYDENGLVEKEECWFKDEVSNTVVSLYNNNQLVEQECISINYLKKEGNTQNLLTRENKNIEIENYLKFHEGYETGKQFYLKLPLELRNGNIINILKKVIFGNDIKIKVTTNYISLYIQNLIIIFKQNSIVPQSIINLNNEKYVLTNYFFENN